MERVLNEGACIKFLAERTNIPLPKVIACFEDDGAAYLILEHIDAVGMHQLNDEEKKTVAEELKDHIRTYQALTSDTWGGPTGMVCAYLIQIARKHKANN
jgi:aminoglycoside phosphotransferase